MCGVDIGHGIVLVGGSNGEVEVAGVVDMQTWGATRHSMEVDFGLVQRRNSLSTD